MEFTKLPGSGFSFVSGGVLSSVNLQNTNQYIKVIVYTNNKLSKKQLINNSIYYSIKRIKCFGRNKTKKGKDLYTENVKILLKEIKEDKNKCKKKTLCSEIKNVYC